jgi:VanZ family protein
LADRSEHNPIILSLSKGVWLWGPVVAWMAVLFWGSALLYRPPTPGLEGFTWDDKLQHTAAYAILGALVWRALGPSSFDRLRMGSGRSPSTGSGRWLRVGIAVLVASGYGAFDECHQFFVPARECSFSDWSADSAGAALAGIVLGLVSADRRHSECERHPERSEGSQPQG